MTRLNYRLPSCHYDSREGIVLIKACAWLVVLTWGNPDLLGALVALVQRIAP
jgi:hypothetical protein